MLKLVAAACLLLLYSHTTTTDSQCESPIGPGHCVSESSCGYVKMFQRILPPIDNIISNMRRTLKQHYCKEWQFCCPINMINDIRTKTIKPRISAECTSLDVTGRCIQESNCDRLQNSLRILSSQLSDIARDILKSSNVYDHCDEDYFCCPILPSTTTNKSPFAATCTSLAGPGRCVIDSNCAYLQIYLDTLTSNAKRIARNLLKSYYHCNETEPPPRKTTARAKPITITTTTTPSTLHFPRINYDSLPFTICGPWYDEYRIQNGDVTGLSQYPWNVLLVYRSNGTRCGGTLISARYVLTAAHCCITAKPVKVLLGEYDTETNPDCLRNGECADPVQERRIVQTIIHPKFNRANMWNDIALLRFDKPADFTKENVKPICLPFHHNFRYKQLRSVDITGWGRTEQGITSHLLRRIHVNVTHINICRELFRNTRVASTQICTGGRTKRNTCGGDSGSPLQHLEVINNDERMVQYGIVSAGNCKQNDDLVMYGLHTRLDHYLDWIVESVR